MKAMGLAITQIGGEAKKVLVTLSLLLAVTSAFAGQFSARVVGVIDGDTIDVLAAGNEQIRIRISGIDAPERRQAFGQVAKRKMSDLVMGKVVLVEGAKRDRYGRLIGKVIVDGDDAGLSLIRSGLAWHYKRYQKDQSLRDRGMYSAAEDSARVEGVGLWSARDAVPPWEWRRKSQRGSGEQRRD